MYPAEDSPCRLNIVASPEARHYVFRETVCITGIICIVIVLSVKIFFRCGILGILTGNGDLYLSFGGSDISGFIYCLVDDRIIPGLHIIHL